MPTGREFPPRMPSRGPGEPPTPRERTPARGPLCYGCLFDGLELVTFVATVRFIAWLTVMFTGPMYGNVYLMVMFVMGSRSGIQGAERSTFKTES